MTSLSELAPRDAVFLGPQILQLIEYSGLKQVVIARRIGVDQSIIYLWAKDRRAVPRNRIPALAKALETTVEELMDAARITPNGYVAYYGQGVTEVEEAPVEDVLLQYTAKPVRPSRVPLSWCSSTHGTGRWREHHHGTVPVWGPVGRIADL